MALIIRCRLIFWDGLNGIYFCVRSTILLVPAFANDLIIFYDNTTNERIWCNMTLTH